MPFSTVKRAKQMTCPTCGHRIRFQHDRRRLGTCPECGEWLIQRSAFSRRLDLVDEESKSDAFDESDQWAQRVVDELE